ncbi:hypothetical protein EBR16_08885, partial [bacterium]|nr:hypothetical protein [bacterium]
MLAFFRGLLVFLLGAVFGAVGILLFLPTFSVTFSNRPENRAVAKVAPFAAELKAKYGITYFSIGGGIGIV